MPNTLSRRNRAGLVLAGLLGLADAASLLFTTPEGEVGPPLAVLAVGTVVGLVTLAAVVAAWRTGSRTALRVTAGSRIVSVILGLPAFLVDEVPPALVAVSAVGTALTVVAVVLVLAPAGRPAPVTD